MNLSLAALMLLYRFAARVRGLASGLALARQPGLTSWTHPADRGLSPNPLRRGGPVSLGICALRASTLADLRCRMSASDRGIPLVAEANCTLIARVPRIPDLLIRRSGRVVQKRPLRSVRWADIPQLSTRGERRPAAWQQYWQQSRPNGVDPRPSVFQAGHISSWAGSRGCYWLSPVAVACRWLLLLLSPLLSAQPGSSGGQPDRAASRGRCVRTIGAQCLITDCHPFP
jgi:hypothetical protein